MDSVAVVAPRMPTCRIGVVDMMMGGEEVVDHDGSFEEEILRVRERCLDQGLLWRSRGRAGEVYVEESLKNARCLCLLWKSAQ